MLPSVIFLLAAILVMRAKQSNWIEPPHTSLWAGGFVILVFAFSSLILWMFERLEAETRNLALVIFGLIFLILVYYCKTHAVHGRVDAANHDNAESWKVFVVYIFLVQITWLIHHAYLPIFGWDVLDFWGFVSGALLQFHLRGIGLSDYLWSHYHPFTISRMLAVPQLIGDRLQAVFFPSSPWLLFALSNMLIAYGYSRTLGNCRSASLVVAILVASLPLAENGYVVAGYGEVLVGGPLLLAVSSLALWLRRQDARLLLVAVASICFLLTLKNTGVFYASLPAAMFVFCLVFPMLRYLAVIIAKFFVLLVIVGLFFLFENSLHLGWAEFMSSEHKLVIDFAGKQLELIATDPKIIVTNQIHAYFFNATFSVSILFFILFCFSIRPHSPAFQSEIFLVLVIGSGLFCMMAIQFTDYGFTYAVPSRDTGNSRFSLPILMICPLLVAHIFLPKRDIPTAV